MGLRQHSCSIFRRLLQNEYRTYWLRELQQPRSFHSGPVRREASNKTTRPGMSSRDEELKGESNENVADGGIGIQNYAGAGAENILTGDRDDLRQRRPHGRLRGARGVFFPSGFPFHVGDFCPIHSHIHRMWGSIGGRGTTAVRGRRGVPASRSLRGSGRGYE